MKETGLQSTFAAAAAPAPALLNILIVEDNPTDALLLDEALVAQNLAAQSTRATTLEQCRRAIAEQVFDAVLLDLHLPDSRGMDTLAALNSLAPFAAIIVLTGSTDESLGIEAMRHGAQDYLSKCTSCGPILARVVRYAVERQRHGLNASLERFDREIHSVERLSEHQSTSLTARMYGGSSLHERAPEQFLDLLDRYRELLEQKVEERLYRVERPSEAEDVRKLCQDVATLRGGPRDVIEIHVASLRSAIEGSPDRKPGAYLEEGRILVLEMMGFLAGFYRNYYPGIREVERGSS